MARALFQRPDDWILGAAAVTATVAPDSSYDLATLLGLRPSTRVLWSVKTVTITFTLGSAARGDLFALPMHNLDPGSSVLTLTNGSGLSQAITIPALPADGLPRTVVVDLTVGTPLAATRTSTTWNLVIASNSVNVALGGAVWIGTPTRTFEKNYVWSPIRSIDYQVDETQNAYGELYTVDYGTLIRDITCNFSHASTADRAALEDWYRACHGRAKASLFWPDPTVNDALVGHWPKTYAETLIFATVNQIPLAFVELSKGLAL